MSEVTSVGGEPSLPAPGIAAEEVTVEQVDCAIKEGRRAIGEGDFLSALQKIEWLCAAYEQSKEREKAHGTWMGSLRALCGCEKTLLAGEDILHLFRALCTVDHEEGKKLLPTLGKYFTINVQEEEGYQYTISWAASVMSFLIPVQTDKEAKALLERLYSLNDQRDFITFERELPRLVKLCAENRVSRADFLRIYMGAIDANASFALKWIPIFADIYTIELGADILYINSEKTLEKWKVTTPLPHDISAMLDCDAAIARIARRVGPLNRLNGYLNLASHQLEREPEVLERAKQELEQINDPLEKVRALFTLLTYYGWARREEFFQIAGAIEKRLKALEQSDYVYFLCARLAIYRALYESERNNWQGVAYWLGNAENWRGKIYAPSYLIRLQKGMESMRASLTNSRCNEKATLPMRKV